MASGAPSKEGQLFKLVSRRTSNPGPQTGSKSTMMSAKGIPGTKQSHNMQQFNLTFNQ